MELTLNIMNSTIDIQAFGLKILNYWLGWLIGVPQRNLPSKDIKNLKGVNS